MKSIGDSNITIDEDTADNGFWEDHWTDSLVTAQHNGTGISKYPTTKITFCGASRCKEGLMMLL